MHRYILGLKQSDAAEVDHLNRDRLDNRRANLLPGTRGDNMRNRSSFRGSTSRYSGVYRVRDGNVWRATVKVEGRRHNLGRFADEDDAGRAVAAFRGSIKAPSCVALYEVDIDGERVES